MGRGDGVHRVLLGKGEVQGALQGASRAVVVYFNYS